MDPVYDATDTKGAFDADGNEIGDVADVLTICYERRMLLAPQLGSSSMERYSTRAKSGASLLPSPLS